MQCGLGQLRSEAIVMIDAKLLATALMVMALEEERLALSASSPQKRFGLGQSLPPLLPATPKAERQP